MSESKVEEERKMNNYGAINPRIGFSFFFWTLESHPSSWLSNCVAKIDYVCVYFVNVWEKDKSK